METSSVATVLLQHCQLRLLLTTFLSVFQTDVVYHDLKMVGKTYYYILAVVRYSINSVILIYLSLISLSSDYFIVP
jgi:hypothetical protein